MNKKESIKIEGERFSAILDDAGNIQRIAFQNKLFEPPMKYTLFEINGQMADVSKTETLREKTLSLKLATKEASGTLTVSSGKDVGIHFEPDKKEAVKNVGIVIPFPLETEFHIPEYMNLGRKIDCDMPVGEWYSTQRYGEEFRYMRGLGYNFFLADYKGMWFRFMVKEPNDFQRVRVSDVHISRHPETFIVTFTWNTADDAYIDVFSSMDEATRDYEMWLEKDLGIKKMRDRPNMPEWVHDVKFVFIVDMMRPNWEISHDYNDVANMAKELKAIGCPKDTLFYIPGSNGAYDSTYPTYGPHPDLGGEEKFKEMIDVLHENGFRVMIHTNAWGVDPCHPNIDKFLKYLVKDKNGEYAGWQTGTFTKWGIMAPQSRPLKFRTEKIPFKGPKGAKSFTFKTVCIPDSCESRVAVGGLKVGDARVKFTIDRRSISTPAAWFKDHDEYAFPFPFLLKSGENRVQVEVIGGDAKPDWSEAWYKIRYCFVPLNPYYSWSYPILFADTNNPEWIKIFVDNVESVVRKYDIDAVHIDATEYHSNKKLYDALKEKLPKVALAGESFSTLDSLGYWTFMQQGMQNMIGYLDITRGTTQQGSLPDTSAIEELYSWLDKPSPVCRFVKDYIHIYPHLCAADSFVPIGKVCNTFPTRFSPRCAKELWRITRDARRLDYIPGLRLSYRKYGLDEETKKAIREVASSK